MKDIILTLIWVSFLGVRFMIGGGVELYYNLEIWYGNTHA